MRKSGQFVAHVSASAVSAKVPALDVRVCKMNDVIDRKANDQYDSDGF